MNFVIYEPDSNYAAENAPGPNLAIVVCSFNLNGEPVMWRTAIPPEKIPEAMTMKWQSETFGRICMTKFEENVTDAALIRAVAPRDRGEGWETGFVEIDDS